MKKPKVLIIQESVMTYRAPIYEYQMPYRKIGPFTWHKKLNKILSKYDVVVFVTHLSLIRLISKVYSKALAMVCHSLQGQTPLPAAKSQI